MVTAGKRLQHDDEEGGYALFSAPQRGEYANTTNFITSDNWQASLDMRTQRGGVSHVAMFTDGIQSIALNAISGNTPHSPFFDLCFAGWRGKWTLKMPKTALPPSFPHPG